MTDRQKLISIINEIQNLIRSHSSSSSPDFQAWKSKVNRFLIRIYGDDSYEKNEFGKIHFSPGVVFSGMSDDMFTRACANGLRNAEAILRTYLEDFVDQENIDDSLNKGNASIANRKVFIVHGHDHAIKEAVARLVERQGIGAIILHEQANSGATIIEKFEKNSDANAAICLFTADDVGKANAESDYKKRARQNVVFETGYFIGKLGRNRVIIITDRGIDIPSDMQGVVYADSSSWKFSVLQELKAMGFEIDYNRLDS